VYVILHQMPLFDPTLPLLSQFAETPPRGSDAATHTA